MYLARAPFQIRAASETPAPLRCLQEIGSVLRPLKNEYLLAQSFAVEHKASEGLDFGLMCFFSLEADLMKTSARKVNHSQVDLARHRSHSRMMSLSVLEAS